MNAAQNNVMDVLKDISAGQRPAAINRFSCPNFIRHIETLLCAIPATDKNPICTLFNVHPIHLLK